MSTARDTTQRLLADDEFVDGRATINETLSGNTEVSEPPYLCSVHLNGDVAAAVLESFGWAKSPVKPGIPESYSLWRDSDGLPPRGMMRDEALLHALTERAVDIRNNQED